MANDVRVLLLPGRGNAGPKHWQSFWEKKHPEYVRVVQSEWDSPHREDWVTVLNDVIQADSTPVVLVAHSLSVSLVNHWAAQHKGPVKAAFLVAPSDVEHPNYPSGTEGFAPIPQDRLPFQTLVVASTNDPRVSLERAEQFAKAWGSRLVVAGEFGHLGSDAELGDWAFGTELFEQLLSEVGE